MDNQSGYYKYTEEFPRVSDIRKWVAGRPDADQLMSIISRSFEYIQKLPLKGIKEKYIEEVLLFSDSIT